MKARIYQFIILMLQFICGSLVVKSEQSFLFNFFVIILLIAIVGSITFVLYGREIIKQSRKEKRQ
mgnify:CR=1 FL=1